MCILINSIRAWYFAGVVVIFFFCFLRLLCFGFQLLRSAVRITDYKLIHAIVFLAIDDTYSPLSMHIQIYIRFQRHLFQCVCRFLYPHTILISTFFFSFILPLCVPSFVSVHFWFCFFIRLRSYWIGCRMVFCVTILYVRVCQCRVLIVSASRLICVLPINEFLVVCQCVSFRIILNISCWWCADTVLFFSLLCFVLSLLRYFIRCDRAQHKEQ